MIIEIKEELFNSNDFKSLNYLIQILTYKQRYELFVEWSIIKDTEYWQKLDFDEQNEIENNYNRIIQEGTEPKYFVAINNNQNNYFDIDEAIRFFNQPVSIILENSLNDQYFLLAIIKYFDATRKIQKQLDEGWIKFENAGGCTNVINFIKGKLQSFNNLSYQNNRFNHIYLRCFVLLDSDKEYPDAPIKEEYKKLLLFLDKNNISNHILEKRCMENYMPDEVFSYIAAKSELSNWSDAYIYLNMEQKNFLNINEGFSKKNQDGISKKQRNELKQEIQNLYVDISQTNYEKLDKGFKLKDFKTEFPKNFISHHQVNKSTLQERCGTNEFQDIIDKIVTLL
ncbi:MAG: hypothetical protein KAI79_13595 [Bacteroidales bacterium]|nr:hypothetical protein [Bacteroidales bacterium]